MTLSETWFVEGYIDFELQKYKLLAYLKQVNECFDRAQLYPQLGDVIFHYNNLNSFRNNKQFLQNQFPKRLDKLNIEKLELTYTQMLEDDDLMQELGNIVLYAMDNMKKTIDSGTQLYEYVEQQLHIEPVGILPLYKNEGYMLLRYGNFKEIRAYAYTITLFEHKDAKYKGLKMTYVDSWTSSIVYTQEMVKKEIIKQYPNMPVPAVFAVHTPLVLPLDETLLPVAKRSLVRHIEKGAC